MGRGGRALALFAVIVLAVVAFVPGGRAMPQMVGSPMPSGLWETGLPRPDGMPILSAAPPSTTIELIGTVGQTEWFVSPVLVILHATDDVDVDITWYRIDTGPWQPYVVPFQVSDDGNHTVDFFSHDREGLTEDRKTTWIPVDTNPPVFLSLGPEGTVTKSDVVIEWGAEDPASGIARFEVSVGNGPFEDMGLQTSKTVSLGDGRHTVRVRAVDVAGNNASTEFTFQVDTFFFSATGPQATLLLVLIFGVNAAIVLAVLSIRRRKRS